METSGGDTIEWKDGAVYKNGEVIKEPKVEETTVADSGSATPSRREIPSRRRDRQRRAERGCADDAGRFFVRRSKKRREYWPVFPRLFAKYGGKDASQTCATVLFGAALI